MPLITSASLQNLINAHTLTDSQLSDSQAGENVKYYLNISNGIQLNTVSSHIRYRSPVIADFGNTQYFQSAGLTWYFREGTCIDISRLVYFTGKALGLTPTQLIVFNGGYTIGHAVTILQSSQATYVIDYTNTLILPAGSYATYIDEIGAFIQNDENFTPVIGFPVTYSKEFATVGSPLSISPSQVVYPIKTYNPIVSFLSLENSQNVLYGFLLLLAIVLLT